MVNITHKSNSLRKAVAEAILTVSKKETIDAIVEKRVPKGDVFEFSRAAGLLAIKKTSDVIPDCHPLPVEFATIKHEVDELRILITVEVHTIYKTGVEVEAMHGASITALTMYDMLKPLDKSIEISGIKLLSKSGGKSDQKWPENRAITAAVIVCSDTVSANKQEDKTGKMIVEFLTAQRILVNAVDIIPDDFDAIQAKAKEYSNGNINLILFAGGTGVSPRDRTPEAIRPMLTLEIPGIMETARQYGQQRTPYAMLSRGVAGFIDQSLVLTLPGSVNGALETMQALFPFILHLFAVAEGKRHE